MNKSIIGVPQPISLTYADLQLVVAPFLIGDKWAEDTIGDLWRMGAPALSGGLIGTPEEKRIILPSQLLEWCRDVAERRGLPLQ